MKHFVDHVIIMIFFKFLPPSWHKLMFEPTSPIIDMYPTDFALDMNGKKFEWMGVVLLPFLDEDRLHKGRMQFNDALLYKILISIIRMLYRAYIYLFLITNYAVPYQGIMYKLILLYLLLL